MNHIKYLQQQGHKGQQQLLKNIKSRGITPKDYFSSLRKGKKKVVDNSSCNEPPVIVS